MKKTNNAFKMPNPVKITGRTSSITNSFVNGVIPVIYPSEEEVKEALSILEMNPEDVRCAYCGDPMTEWDHLRALIVNKQPSGYISEIHNLIPACSKCNQSKGNSPWKEWMFGNAPKSPASRKIRDIEHRCLLIENYEKWGTPIKIDIKRIVGETAWEKHWTNWKNIIALMHDSQKLSDEIENILKEHITPSTKAEKVIKKESQSGKGEVIITEKKIANIAKGEFLSFLNSDECNDEIIKNLLDINYSNNTFNVGFPILIKLDSPEDYSKAVDSNGYSRYYKNPVLIKSEPYLLTSQWFERSRKPLTDWLKKNKYIE